MDVEITKHKERERLSERDTDGFYRNENNENNSDSNEND